MADSSSEGTLANLSKYSQSSILTHLETLDGDDRSALLSSLSELDFEGIFDRHVPSALNSKAPDSIQPFPEDNCVDLNDDVSTSSQSVVSPCIMAGGAGTRLGFDGPKGCYSLIRNKTLYDFLIPRCATNCLKTGAPVLIMTSPVNHEETVDWFRKREWYKSHGLEESGEGNAADSEPKPLLVLLQWNSNSSHRHPRRSLHPLQAGHPPLSLL